jgi:hypothetical protein
MKKHIPSFTVKWGWGRGKETDGQRMVKPEGNWSHSLVHSGSLQGRGLKSNGARTPPPSFPYMF